MKFFKTLIIEVFRLKLSFAIQKERVKEKTCLNFQSACVQGFMLHAHMQSTCVGNWRRIVVLLIIIENNTDKRLLCTVVAIMYYTLFIKCQTFSIIINRLYLSVNLGKLQNKWNVMKIQVRTIFGRVRKLGRARKYNIRRVKVSGHVSGASDAYENRTWKARSA